jgi:hypothetical protein
MSMASTFFRPTGVKETWSDHAEGGEINFSLGTGLSGLILVWKEEELY